MNRRTLLTGMTLLGLAIATLPQPGFAQSNLENGLWQLNLAKSKYSPASAPKSGTVYIQGEGQNQKLTAVGIKAQGNPTVLTTMPVKRKNALPRSFGPVFYPLISD